MIKRMLLSLMSLAAALTAHAQGTPLPATTPEAVGFSSERLRRIDDFFAHEIERNRVAGAVVAIARNGKLVHYRAYGWADKDKGIRAGTDTLFQLASMTKIMTAVGALSLTEEGRLPLQSRLADYYPGFATMPVGVPSADGKIGHGPQKRPILIHDLFRHISGLTYGGRPDGGHKRKNLSLPAPHRIDERRVGVFARGVGLTWVGQRGGGGLGIGAHASARFDGGAEQDRVACGQPFEHFCRVEDQHEPRRATFETAMHLYVRFYLEHMHIEEAQVLPLAEAMPVAADWAELDDAFLANRDPLAGHNAVAAYRPLFTKIIGALPADSGVGSVLEALSGVGAPKYAA